MAGTACRQIGVAFSAHGTICTAAAAAAGGFSLFLIPYHAGYYCRYYGNKHGADNYCSKIFANPRKHLYPSVKIT